MSPNPNRLVGLVLVLCLIGHANSAHEPTVGQIDRKSDQIKTWVKDVDGKLVTAWQQAQSIKTLNSKLVQSKFAAADTYTAFFNENERCKGLDFKGVNWINYTAIDLDKCLVPPLSPNADDQYLYWLELEQLEHITYYSEWFYRLYANYTSIKEEHVWIAGDLSEAAKISLARKSQRYQDCLDQFQTGNNTQPVECEELRAQFEKASALYEKFYTWELNVTAYTNETEADLEAVREEYEANLLNETNYRDTVQASLDDLQGVYKICLENKDKFKELLNTRLKTAHEDKKNVEQQVKKVDKLYDDVERSRDKVKKNVADIKGLAAKLKTIL